MRTIIFTAAYRLDQFSILPPEHPLKLHVYDKCNKNTTTPNELTKLFIFTYIFEIKMLMKILKNNFHHMCRRCQEKKIKMTHFFWIRSTFFSFCSQCLKHCSLFNFHGQIFRSKAYLSAFKKKSFFIFIRYQQ